MGQQGRGYQFAPHGGTFHSRRGYLCLCKAERSLDGSRCALKHRTSPRGACYRGVAGSADRTCEFPVPWHGAFLVAALSRLQAGCEAFPVSVPICDLAEAPGARAL